MIMAGSARLTAAMMWERKEGTMWRKMMRMLRGAGELGRGDEILLAQRQEAAADDARKLGPADQRDDHGDGEIDLGDAPGGGQGGGQAHPQAGWSGSSAGSR